MSYSMKRCFMTSMQILSIFFFPEKYCSAVVEKYSSASEWDGFTEEFIQTSDQENQYAPNNLVGKAKQNGTVRHPSDRIKDKEVHSTDTQKRITLDYSRGKSGASNLPSSGLAPSRDRDYIPQLVVPGKRRKGGGIAEKDLDIVESALRNGAPKLTTNENELELRQQDGKRGEYRLPETWCLEKGKMLRDGLRSWENRAGWTLFWDLEYDYPILAPVCFQGVFEKVLEELTNAYGDAERPFYLDIYPQQKLAVVSN